jgi:hypothetical protein
MKAKQTPGMSGGKIAVIVIMAVLAIIIGLLIFDYYRCKNAKTPCTKKYFWRFWMPTPAKTSPYSRRLHPILNTVHSPYARRPPMGQMPPIPSTAGTNEIIEPYTDIVDRKLQGTRAKMI